MNPRACFSERRVPGLMSLLKTWFPNLTGTSVWFGSFLIFRMKLSSSLSGTTRVIVMKAFEGGFVGDVPGGQRPASQLENAQGFCGFGQRVNLGTRAESSLSSSVTSARESPLNEPVRWRQ